MHIFFTVVFLGIALAAWRKREAILAMSRNKRLTATAVAGASAVIGAILLFTLPIVLLIILGVVAGVGFAIAHRSNRSVGGSHRSSLRR